MLLNVVKILFLILLQKDNDRDHSVRLAIGNGMKREIWKEFLCRFGCLKVYEFYGATEGNLGFINYIGKVGAIGRINFLYKVTKLNWDVADILMRI